MKKLLFIMLFCLNFTACIKSRTHELKSPCVSREASGEEISPCSSPAKRSSWPS
jgi:hypothetical protein